MALRDIWPKLAAVRPGFHSVIREQWNVEVQTVKVQLRCHAVAPQFHAPKARAHVAAIWNVKQDFYAEQTTAGKHLETVLIVASPPAKVTVHSEKLNCFIYPFGK